jgi:hypothetical protein
MRPFRRAILVLCSLLLLAGGITVFGLDGILKRTIQTEATKSLKLRTTLRRAHLSLLGGKLDLKGLRIASPPGFSAPDMLELGAIDVAVKYDQLRKDPIHVESLTIDRPKFVIEQSHGSLNFRKAIDRMPTSQGSSSGKPMKLVIDQVNVRDAQVIIRPGLPGMGQEITVSVPSITLKNVGSGGGSQNGAAIKDVASEVIAALAGSAAKAGSLPAALTAMLHLNVGQVAGKLGADAQKEISAAIPGGLSNISKVVANPQGLITGPAKSLEGKVGGILGGKSSDPAQPKQQQAAGRASNSSK